MMKMRLLDTLSSLFRRGTVLVLVAAVSLPLCVSAQEAARVANREIPGRADTVTPEEHPLMPVLRWAETGRPDVAKVRDYTATVTKQENINGELQEAQVMDIKVRHQPFSVYLKFRYPRSAAGREAIYVQGANDGKLVAHGVGMEKVAGTQFLDTESFLAMRGNKYPITKMGILNLVDELVTVGRLDIKYGECEVKYYKDVEIDKRLCTLIEVTHPVPRPHFRFHKARIFVDNELGMPTRYESYDWPKTEGEKPGLIEAYTYQKLKLNVGLTDADFDHTNVAYGYRESGKKQ